MINDNSNNYNIGKERFFNVIRDNFDKWDKNKDSYISDDELESRMNDKIETNTETAVLYSIHLRKEAVKRLFDDKEDGYSGITNDDLDVFQKYSTNMNFFLELENKLDTLAKELFKNDTPDHNSIKQGNAGDCYFLAALSSLAKTRPDEIKKMIQDNQDGTFTVAFKDREPVIIEAPTGIQQIRYGISENDGLWASVMEKAFAYSEKRRIKDQGTDVINSDNAYDYITGEHLDENKAIKALTGNDIIPCFFFEEDQTFHKFVYENNNINEVETNITSEIKNGLDNKKIVMAVATKPKDSAISENHAYSLLDYSKDEKGEYVIIRNPWGISEPGKIFSDNSINEYYDAENDGVFKISLKNLSKYFPVIKIEN